MMKPVEAKRWARGRKRGEGGSICFSDVYEAEVSDVDFDEKSVMMELLDCEHGGCAMR